MKTLPNDISRCSNHTCKLKNDCMRYAQVTIDFHNDRTNALPVTKFEGTKKDEFDFVIECDNQITSKQELTEIKN